jgi:Tfp pilus assembly protein PilV
MSPDAKTDRLRAEAGFSLIELIVAATILVIASIGIFSALEAAGRAGQDQRERAQAYQVAQQDQARMRAIKATQLLDYANTRTVTVDDTNFTVKSSSKIVTDSTGTQTCDSGTASADYLTITSTVTWPTIGTRPPVVIQSIIAPPNGTFDESTGALAVAVQDGQGLGVPNIALSGTGAGSFSGMTGDNGCAIFANLPAGNYTLTPSASTYVDKDGNQPGPVTTSVVAQSTNSVALQLDRPGSIDVTFLTKVGSTLVPSQSDTIVAFNTGMTTAETFGTVGTEASTLSATPLFPFSSPDTVYAGTCTGNNPQLTAAGVSSKSVTVNAGGPAVPAQLTLPALNLTVWKGTSSINTVGPLSGARVTLTDKNCSVNGSGVKRVFTTNSSGNLPDPGVPWSVYDVCVSGIPSGTTVRRVTTTNLAVKDPTIPTTLNVYLGGSATTGACP